jgi:hypothetical protein
MASLISLGLKGKDGKYTNITVAVNDETNQFGQNVSAWVEQTKEQREAKEKKNYIGNGKVVWTDNGKVIKAGETKQASELAEADGLDF